MWILGLLVLVGLMVVGFHRLTFLWLSDPWPDVDQAKIPSPKPRHQADAVARELVAAVAALRRAGADEEWIRTFVTFEAAPEPEPKPIGDNRALLAELKTAWETRTPTPLVPIRPGYQGYRLVRGGDLITLRDMNGDIVREEQE